METNILVAGVGGQGSILASHVIAEAAIMAHGDKYNVRVGETFGAAQRGGAVCSHVRIGENVYGPLVGAGCADLLVALEPLEALRIGLPYLSSGGIAIVNPSAVTPVDVKVGAVQYPKIEDIEDALHRIGKKVVLIDGSYLASEAGSAKVLSVVMIGAAFATGLVPVDRESLISAISRKVPSHTVDMNIHAFGLGESACLEALNCRVS
jgi:indolepyruvate ferredoxin oxidoreductase beta subunit